MVQGDEAVESALVAGRRNLVAFLEGYYRVTDGKGYLEGRMALRSRRVAYKKCSVSPTFTSTR